MSSTSDALTKASAAILSYYANREGGSSLHRRENRRSPLEETTSNVFQSRRGASFSTGFSSQFGRLQLGSAFSSEETKEQPSLGLSNSDRSSKFSDHLSESGSSEEEESEASEEENSAISHGKFRNLIAQNTSNSARVNLGVGLFDAFGNHKANKKPKEKKSKEKGVFIRSPTNPTEIHSAGGRVRRESVPLMILCVKEGIPCDQGKELSILKYYGKYFQEVGSRIGLTAFMNGINVKQKEFIEYGHRVYEKVNHLTPVIGLYNETEGLIKDLKGLIAKEVYPDAIISKFSKPIRIMRSFLKAIASRFYGGKGMHCNTGVLLVAHSEGALILNIALNRLRTDVKRKLRPHLHIITLGPVHPVKSQRGEYVVNIYSKKDYITTMFAGPFLSDPNYNIELVGCISKTDERIVKLVDHSFLGRTYQEHLRKKIEFLTNRFGLGRR